jgi:hypothetical protein
MWEIFGLELEIRKKDHRLVQDFGTVSSRLPVDISSIHMLQVEIVKLVSIQQYLMHNL